MVARIEHKTRTGCPVACSLDIFGDHWTLLIIRNLMFLDLHEYKDMQAKEEKISSNILSVRLKSLEENGVIASIPHPESKKRKLYYLTEMGKGLLDMMVEMVLWANLYLSEHLAIPAEKKQLLETEPDKFKAIIRAQMAEWEAKYLA